LLVVVVAVVTLVVGAVRVACFLEQLQAHRELMR
jgi:hypothetical protein